VGEEGKWLVDWFFHLCLFHAKLYAKYKDLTKDPEGMIFMLPEHPAVAPDRVYMWPGIGHASSCGKSRKVYEGYCWDLKMYQVSETWGEQWRGRVSEQKKDWPVWVTKTCSTWLEQCASKGSRFPFRSCDDFPRDGRDTVRLNFQWQVIEPQGCRAGLGEWLLPCTEHKQIYSISVVSKMEGVLNKRRMRSRYTSGHSGSNL
jgi:hypothetical protein